MAVLQTVVVVVAEGRAEASGLEGRAIRGAGKQHPTEAGKDGGKDFRNVMQLLAKTLGKEPRPRGREGVSLIKELIFLSRSVCKCQQRLQTKQNQPDRLLRPIQTSDFRFLPVSQPHLSAVSDTHE